MNREEVQSILDEKPQERTQFMKDNKSMRLMVKIRPILIGNNYWVLITKFGLQTINAVLPILYFLSNSSKRSQISNLFEDYINDIITATLQEQILAFSFSVSIVISLNIIFYSLLQKEMHKIVFFLNRKLNNMIPTLIQINITASALLFIKNNQLTIIKIANFTFVCIVSAFIDTFMQCTSKQTDLLNSDHPLFIAIFRISSLILLFMCIICSIFKLSQYIVIAFGAVFLIIIFKFYLRDGYRNYRKPLSKNGLLLSITFFLSTCIEIVVSISINSSYFDFLFTLIVIYIILFFMVQNKSQFVFNPTNFGLHDIEILLANFQELVDHINVDEKCFLIGLLHQHKQTTCQNIHCYSHKNSVYCTAVDGDVNINNEFKFDSIFRYFIKCFFEQSILHQPQNYQIVLRYCQYSYYEMSNILPLALHIERLKKIRLSLYQQVRVYNLQKSLRQTLEKSNHASFNNRLPFQRVFQYEAICQRIAYANCKIVQQNINLWDLFSTPTILTSDVLSATDTIRQACKDVENNIRGAQQQFKSWPKLQRLIAFYALYADNSFKKDKTVHILRQNLSGQKDDQKSEPHRKPRDPKSGEPVFGQVAAIIHCRLFYGRLLIKHYSIGTTSLLQFGKQDLIGCDIITIMPDFFRNHHLEKLTHWMDQGFVNHERFQKGVATFCLTKDKRIRSVTKTFKLFVTDDGDVDFVCLLKDDPTRINSVICNKEFLIEETSRQFEQTFQIIPNHHPSAEKTNLQQLIPNLRKIVNEFSQQVQSTQKNNTGYFLKISSQPFILQISTLNYGQQKFLFNFKPTLAQDYQQQSIHFLDTFNPFATSQLRLQKLKNKKIEKQPLPNIFMKDELMTPNESMKEMRHIKYILHTFFLILILIFFTMMTIINENYLTLEDYIEQYEVFLKVTKEPFLLGIRYYLLLCNISDQSNLIQSRTDSFLQYSETQTFKRTLFNNQFSFNGYDEINNSAKVKEKTDLFYAVSSSISSFRNGTIDFNSTQFQIFNSVIFPDFFYMIDLVKDTIYQNYRQLYKNISAPNLVLLEAQSALFALVVILVTYKFAILSKKWKQVFQIIVKIDKEELKIAKNHWGKLLIRFASQQIGRKVQKEALQTITFSSKYQVQSDKKISRSQRRVYLTALFSLTSKFLITAVLEVFISSAISNLQEFGNVSQPLYDFYPSNTVTGYGMIQKYYNSTFLNISQSAYDDYEDAITDPEQVSDYQYMASPIEGNSAFFKAIKNYYFDNPCAYKPSILDNLNVTVDQCLYEGHLAEGIVSFELGIQPTVEAYFKNNITLSQSQISDIIKWMIVEDGYLEDIVGIWATEFISRTQSARTISVKLYLLMTFLILVVHYVIAHRSFILKLDDLFKRYTMTYNILMTSSRIQKNKIVRSELISLGFLRQ